MQINKYAHDIILYFLKCNILVPDDIWNVIVQAFIPVLPILACYADKSTTLGQNVMTMLDPDRALDLKFSTTQVSFQ